jgi:predicted ATPase/class 3 adenylate cyclase
MRDLPSGTVTFLFTDIEGSTKLLHELGAVGYAGALEEHRRILRDAFAAHGGVEVDTQGDAFFVAFPTAPGALAAAADAQSALASGPVRVRMGLHTGAPLVADDGYVGVDIHRAARIAAAAHGGQVVVSAATAALADDARLLDLGEHRFKDLAAAERVFQLGDGAYPPLATLYRTNLPVPATPFVGRRGELADVVALAARDDLRLLTLTGPGGTGKTRLAVQAAGEAAEAFPDGVFWAALAPLLDAALVPPTIGAALGVPDEGAGALREALAGRRLLVVLDNAEHLLPAIAAELAALSSADGPTFLVTSRERLQLQGEHVYPVPTLDDADGVALFTARARALDPAFRADAGISELCARLDRLPLAIELAAARTMLFSVEQLLERLGQRLDLLKGGRDADPRQQTLRATIAWSHDLLDAPERRLFARLSVFAGGCTYESAEDVCEADPDVLQSLLDKSLLRRREADGGHRFWMLESIREFAGEVLVAAGEEEELRRRHADHFLALAERAAPKLTGPDQVSSLSRLESEHDNFRSALEHVRDLSGETELRLAGALGRFWYLRGHFGEGRARLHDVLVRRSEPAAARAACLRAGAWMAKLQGDCDTAQPMAEEALALSRSLGDERGVSAALGRLGNIASGRRRPDEARAYYEAGHAAARRAGEGREAAVFLVNLGDLAIAQGDYAAAREYCEQALAGMREADDAQGIATALFNLGLVDLCIDELDAARPHLLEALRLAVDLGDRETMIDCVEAVAAVVVDRKDYGAAARLLAAAEVAREDLGLPPQPAEDAVRARTLAKVREASDPDELGAAWVTGRTLSLDEAVREALDG